MNTEIKELKANVYHIDIRGVDGTWVWDFGSFILFGSEDIPNRQPSNIGIYSAVVDGFDIEKLKNKEPKFQQEVNFYTGDYVVYTKCDHSTATHYISPNGEDYSVVDDSIILDNLDEKSLLLKTEDLYDNESKIFTESELDNNNWTPVVQIS